MSYKEIIDNVSNIENLDNVTILKVLEKFSKTIKDFAIEQSGLNNLINVEFVPSDNNATYDGTAVDYFGTLKLTLSDNIIVNKSCNIKFNIKSSNTIVVDVDEFNNSLELHLDSSVVTTLDFAESERQKSKNLIPYPYYSKTKTTNGITFTEKSNGILNISGTSSADAWYSFAYKTFNIKAGTYVFSIRDANGNLIPRGDIIIQISNNVTSEHVRQDTQKPIVIPKDWTNGYIEIMINPNRTFNQDLYFQLEEGSVATDYQSYYGAIVHEKEVSDVEHIETIYDKEGVLATNIVRTSTIPEGQAYTTGLPSGITCYIETSKYKRLIFYIKVESYQYRIEVDKNINAPNVLVKDFNNNDITILGGYPDNFSTTFGTEGTVIVKIEGVY